MHTVIIVFVPVGATQQEFDEEFREYFASMETDKTRKQAVRPAPVSGDELPLWTWFCPIHVVDLPTPGTPLSTSWPCIMVLMLNLAGSSLS